MEGTVAGEAFRMIRTYSRRLLSPFTGVVQIAETSRARAVSPDGRNWAIQYSLLDRPKARATCADQDSQLSLVATIEGGEMKTRALHPFLDPDAVRSVIDHLLEVVTDARLPVPAADRYEYWLLDGTDGTPLALLHSSVQEEEMALHAPRPVWLAMPAAQLEVSAPEAAPAYYVPPVNYRLQRLIEERAGPRPRAVWFERSAATTDFPPCLIKENWEREEQQRLCDRYINRLAPRLLMLQGLPRPVRRRLEHAARNHAFDVDCFHPLYPEVVDRELMIAARVEAQFRRAAQV
jgi:hypothetical protein